MNDELAQSLLRQIFDYREDGHLVWKVKAKGIQVGKVAGARQPDGRWLINIDCKRYKAHRLIFLWHHGWMPREIDHIDVDQTNNRIENLRPATRSQNNCNKRNVKGFTVVDGRYVAQIKRDRRNHYLGTFDTAEEAREAYLAGRLKWHADVVVQ